MRVVERFLSLLLALAVAVGSLVLALEVAWAVAGRRPLLLDWRPAYTAGRQDSWDSAPVRAVAIGLLVLGLLLLIAELKPRRTPRLRLAGSEAGVDAAITRRSLRGTLLNVAGQVDGISGARARVGRRSVKVQAVSRLGSPETAKSLTGELESALRARLDALQLAQPPRLRVQVSPRRGAESA